MECSYRSDASRGAVQEAQQLQQGNEDRFNKLTGKAGKQEREEAGADSLDHSKSHARRGSGAHGGHAHRVPHK